MIEFKPLNRYSLRVSNAFHGLADGPVQQYVREHVVADSMRQPCSSACLKAASTSFFG